MWHLIARSKPSRPFRVTSGNEAIGITKTGGTNCDLAVSELPTVSTAGPVGHTDLQRPVRGMCHPYHPLVREERIENHRIPGRLYDPGDPRGLLLFGHGGAHSKDSDRFVRLCRTYAEQTGLAVVCIDAVDHGERRPQGATAGVPPHWHSNSASQMVADWQTTAAALSSIGAAVAYVGFSMGMIFGAPTVASTASIKAAVFGVGGIPTGAGLEDPQLRAMLLDAASRLEHPEVLMLNMTHDNIFPTEGTHEFFDTIPGEKKRLMFWAGDHDSWPAEAIKHSVDFINNHTT
jgi:pimeloyl-ACP methyl ester carboxylesterase